VDRCGLQQLVLEKDWRLDTTTLPGKGYDDPFNVQISVVQASAGEAMIIDYGFMTLLVAPMDHKQRIGLFEDRHWCIDIASLDIWSLSNIRHCPWCVYGWNEEEELRMGIG
jgi:hypothetical protein